MDTIRGLINFYATSTVPPEQQQFATFTGDIRTGVTAVIDKLGLQNQDIEHLLIIVCKQQPYNSIYGQLQSYRWSCPCHNIILRIDDRGDAWVEVLKEALRRFLGN